MPSFNQQRPLPLSLILVATVVILALAIWRQKTGNEEPDAANNSSRPTLNQVEEMGKRLEESLNGGGNGRPGGKQRGSSSMIDRAMQGEDSGAQASRHIYPETKELATSTTLEKAQEQKPGELIGWVSDDRALPLTDVHIQLEYEEEEEGEEEAPKLETWSNESGLFLMEEIPPGHWSVVAKKENYAQAVQAGIAIKSGERHEPVELRLEPELTLRGKVMAGEEPAEAATIRATREHLSVHSGGRVERARIDYGRTETDANGEFELDQLPAGTLNLRASAPGYARKGITTEVKPKMDLVEIALEPEALISGSVRNEFGASIEGAELTLETRGEKEPVATTKSQEDGSFQFNQLPSDAEYQLTAKAEGYSQATSIAVASGTSQNVIVLRSGGQLEGTVTNFDSGETMANIGVVATAAEEGNDLSLWTRTNSEGKYRITRLPTGTYDVAIVSERFTTAPQLGVKLDTEQKVSGIDFSVYRGIDISGTVVDGESGERLPNATVSLDSRVGPRFLVAKNNSDTTNETGRFEFTNLPQGIYTLEASLDGYMAGTEEESSAHVELVRGELSEPIELKLYRGGVIEGTVVDHTGDPVPEALVKIFHAPGTPGRINTGAHKTTTKANGSFVLEGIPVHDEVHLYVSATAPKKPKGRSGVVVLNRRLTIKSAPITLPIGGKLQATVNETGGVALSGASVSIGHSDFRGDGSPEEWSQETGDKGQVTFDNLPPGGVSVHASMENHLSDGASVTIRPTETAEAELTLEPARAMAGRVRDDRMTPIRKGVVRASPERGATGSGASGINNEGEFHIDTLGKGTFRVEADARRDTPTGQHRVRWRFGNISPTGSQGNIVLTVPFSGVIEGRVYEPDTGNPPPNYHVRVSGHYFDSTGRRWGFGSAHSFKGDETFRFESLPPGTYTVRASASGYLPAQSDEIEVQSPGNFSAGILRLEKGGSLRFKVTDSQTGEPVAGVSAKLTPDGPGGRTNGNGDAVISTITPDIYTLELSHGEFLPKEVELVKITRGKENNLGEIEMDPGGIIFGQISDGEGDPLSGIHVEARSVDTDQVKTGGTDAGGRYSLRGLRPGGHVITYSGRIGNRNVSKSLNLTVSADKKTEQDIVLRADARLVGTLSASDQVDVNRSVVTLYPLRANNTPLINEAIEAQDVTGVRFTAENLAEGSYLVAVQAPRVDGSGSAHWATVAGVSYPQSHTWATQGKFTLSGTILESDGGPPMGDQEVRLELLTAPQSGVGALRRWWQWSTHTNSGGSFEFPNLPSGTYSLTAHNEELQSDILEIVNISGQQSQIRRTFYFEPADKQSSIGN